MHLLASLTVRASKNKKSKSKLVLEKVEQNTISIVMGCIIMVLQVFLLLIVLATGASAEAKPGCPSSCGNVTIPYPFGTSEECYLADDFLITCNDSQPYLTDSEIIVQSISLDTGEMRIVSYASFDCYASDGSSTGNSEYWITFSKFLVSYTRNKITAVGCDTMATVRDRSEKFTTGCLSLCSSIDQVVNGSCSGIGCCETSLPKGTKDFNISVSSFNNHSGITDFNWCGFAFVVEEGEFIFSSNALGHWTKDWSKVNFPVVLDWTIGKTNCTEALSDSSYACKERSECYDPDTGGTGYRCRCLNGFVGNPYLSNGCLDVNECADKTLNDCVQICDNTFGNYSCSCRKGYQGDGRTNRTGCTLIPAIANNYVTAKISIGISGGLVFLFVVISGICWGVRKRKIMKTRQEHFMHNGGAMLKKLLYESSDSLKQQTAKIFTEEELRKATNNFHRSKIVGQGGFGTVYKGTLADKLVAVKKAKIVDPHQIEQFVNEVIILSQTDHPNVVKLLGCCLETSVPILVYEFITNKTLSDHLHKEDCSFHPSLTWENRVRIATETAGALAYMHADAPRHIIHRDIKSANILLTDQFTAKVSDFGISRLVPLDQTQLPTLVQGTFGYIDPEYFSSGLLTEKSDVYSFGIVLLALLTGENVLSPDRSGPDKGLAKYFQTAIDEDRLFEIVPSHVKNEAPAEQVIAIAEIAKICLKTKADKRPTMKFVKSKLEELKGSQTISEMSSEAYPEEVEPLLQREPRQVSQEIELDRFCGSTNTSATFDTIQSQTITTSLQGGR